MDNLPKQIPPGTQAFLYDPAGGKACRDGDGWCPVRLTGLEDTWELGGVCLQIVTPSGMTRWFSASEIQFKRKLRRK